MLSITSLLFEGYPRNFWHIRAEEEEEEEEEEEDLFILMIL
jgi:hypothetical protein